MATTKIEDLPRDKTMTQKEMKAIMGGVIGDCGMPRIGLTPENGRSLFWGQHFKNIIQFKAGLIAVSPITIP